MQRHSFEQAGEHLLVRRADDLFQPFQRHLELRLDLLHRRVPDLDRDASDVELHEVRRRDRHGIRAAQPLAQDLEPVVRGRLVDVEEQVDIGEEVRVSPRAGARQEGAAQRPQLERRRGDPAGECPDVLRRPVHPGRIVDSVC
jgi:hypothetical protein